MTQDTGVGKFVPTGRGLLTYTTMAEAVDALQAIEGDYLGHAAAARAIATEHFTAERVLGRLLAERVVDLHGPEPGGEVGQHLPGLQPLRVEHAVLPFVVGVA